MTLLDALPANVPVSLEWPAAKRVGRYRRRVGEVRDGRTPRFLAEYYASRAVRT